MSNEPKLIGGIGEINFGNQYRQGNRVYSSDETAMCLTAQPLGNSGGYSYLYLVDDDYKSREVRVYKDISPTLRASHNEFKIVERKGSENKMNCKLFGTLNGGGYEKMLESDRRVYDAECISPTLRATAKSGSNKEPKIAITTDNDECSRCVRTSGHGSTDRHAWDVIAEETTDCLVCASRGRENEIGETQQQLEFNITGTSNTITTVAKDNYIAINGEEREMPKGTIEINDRYYRIRKLTPKECWRLMNYSDEDFEKAAAMGTANQHLYKQAGNGIVVACLEHIYDKLFIHTECEEPQQLSLF